VSNPWPRSVPVAEVLWPAKWSRSSKHHGFQRALPISGGLSYSQSLTHAALARGPGCVHLGPAHSCLSGLENKGLQVLTNWDLTYLRTVLMKNVYTDVDIL